MNPSIEYVSRSSISTTSSTRISSTWVLVPYAEPKVARPTGFPQFDIDWTVDPRTGDIRFVGDTRTGKTLSVLELHRGLSNLFDHHEFFSYRLPTTRITDDIITLHVPYNLDDRAGNMLEDYGELRDDLGRHVWN